MLDDPRLVECYGRLLGGVGDAREAIGPARLTSHWPLVGSDFDHGVLVIGQAVYGWVRDWIASEAATPAGRAAIIEASRSVFADLSDPMGWIVGHRVENTPFWRTAHEVADALTPGPGPWYSRIAWANLYPVAPNDRKGNPEGNLREVQTSPAAQLIDAVVQSVDPKLVLVLAGPFIWPFAGPLGLADLPRAEAPFTVTGRRRGKSWICGMHPGGAQRRGWSARRYAGLIVAHAQGLAGSGGWPKP